MKFAGKWMELDKNHPKWGNPDSEKQTQYVLTHKWILDIKQKITRIQSTASKKVGNKKDPKRDVWISRSLIDRSEKLTIVVEIITGLDFVKRQL